MNESWLLLRMPGMRDLPLVSSEESRRRLLNFSSLLNQLLQKDTSAGHAHTRIYTKTNTNTNKKDTECFSSQLNQLLLLDCCDKVLLHDMICNKYFTSHLAGHTTIHEKKYILQYKISFSNLRGT